MAETTTQKKVMDLDAMGVFLGQLQQDFATKEELAAIDTSKLEYATEADVLALFTASDDTGSETP